MYATRRGAPQGRPPARSCSAVPAGGEGNSSEDAGPDGPAQFKQLTALRNLRALQAIFDAEGEIRQTRRAMADLRRTYRRVESAAGTALLATITLILALLVLAKAGMGWLQ